MRYISFVGIQKSVKFVFLKLQIGVSEREFQTLADLGSGNSGSVQKVLHIKSNIVMARKLVRLEVKPSVRNQILKELEFLHKCMSPYIVGWSIP